MYPACSCNAHTSSVVLYYHRYEESGQYTICMEWLRFEREEGRWVSGRRCMDRLHATLSCGMRVAEPRWLPHLGKLDLLHISRHNTQLTPGPCLLITERMQC